MNQPKLKIQKYVPLIISGCSGVGKGTIITNLLSYMPELFELSISYTTRKPRPTEKHGRQYFFVTKQQFQKLIKEDGFLEYCQVHGHYYGTNAAQVQSIINKGKICLLDVDIQGAEKINAKHSNWKFVFITPPSLQEIEARIRGRGMNTEEQIKKRVGNAGKQLKRLSQVSFYKEIMNDKMENCYSKFIGFINSAYYLLIQIQK